MEVLALLVHGLTNSQIASRLYLSVKTIEHHVSQILGKGKSAVAPKQRR
jgi:DNA-binding NarL/FixJ family response regulator